MPRTAPQPTQSAPAAPRQAPKRTRTPKAPARHKHALRLPPPSQGTQRQKSPYSRAKVRALSIAGISDADIIAIHFPGLNRNTIRSWRRNDPEWSTTFALTKPPQIGGRPRKIDKERDDAHQASTTALLEATLPAISSRNAIRAANEADRALAKVEKRKTPLPITNWSEYKTAFSVLRTATGDDNAQGAQVQVNIWGNPGEASAGVARAFRDVTPKQPAITQ